MGHDEDGGRWDDKSKSKSKSESESNISNKSEVTTLLTNAAATATVTATATTSAASVPKLCNEVHNAANVMVVIKTSKAEVHKLPAHLAGLLSCVPNFAIFSDHTGEVDGHIVHDALASVSGEARRTHDEFHEYQTILTDANHKPDVQKTKDLDKWKMLPMVYRAYQMNPHVKFYAFIEADTTLTWTNLLQWVGRLDYRIPYYAGAPAFSNNLQFAQRGSGILLSQGAMRQYAKSYEERYTSEWEALVGKECCGDMVLATALYQAHVEFYTAWPLLQGEQPETLDYTKRHWCAPVVSWHQMTSEQLDKVWTSHKKWTTTHGWEKPYLFRDAFHELIEPHLAAQKDGWDNLSADAKIVAPKGRQQALVEAVSPKQQDAHNNNKPPPTKRDDDNNNNKKKTDKKPEKPNWDRIPDSHPDAADSPATCQKTCHDVEDCMQWRYSHEGDGVCFLGKVLRLGRDGNHGGDGDEEEREKQWSSGWVMERVARVAEEWKCKEVSWRFYQ